MKSQIKTVGILGAGQLARMLAQAAYPLGLKPIVLIRYRDECAIDAAADAHVDRGDIESLRRFCAKCDILTIENEFIDLARLKRAAGRKRIFPSARCLAVVQDKLSQKNSLKRLRIPTLPFMPVRSIETMAAARKRFGPAVVLKKSRFGYDGRGTFIFTKRRPFDPAEFFARHPDFDGYAESLAPFRNELAVIIARNAAGEIKAYPVVESVQKNGMCRWTVAPADIPRRVARRAVQIAAAAIRGFGGVGVFGIELFWLKNGRCVVNEIAPRVHNTGHFTMNACETSQFEQHWRAILGMPLGCVDMRLPGAAMVNMIGRKHAKIPAGAPVTGRIDQPNAWIHWYGKAGPAYERKIGHINALAGTPGRALAIARRIRNKIDI